MGKSCEKDWIPVPSISLGCGMRKPPKVVSITHAKRKQPNTAIEIPVQVAGAIRILACHRTPTQISFSLGPPLQSGERPRPAGSSQQNLIVFPRPGSDANHD
jgi:hypothetical protein